jgi:hypothetical protein
MAGEWWAVLFAAMVGMAWQGPVGLVLAVWAVFLFGPALFSKFILGRKRSQGVTSYSEWVRRYEESTHRTGMLARHTRRHYGIRDLAATGRWQVIYVSSGYLGGVLALALLAGGLS